MNLNYTDFNCAIDVIAYTLIINLHAAFVRVQLYIIFNNSLIFNFITAQLVKLVSIGITILISVILDFIRLTKII